MDAFARLDGRPFISVATRIELEGGVYAHPEIADYRREAVNNLIELLPTLDFRAPMAHVYGQILAATGFSRRKIIDRMIAATAVFHDLTLITTNGEDFSDIKGLQLMVWNI